MCTSAHIRHSLHLCGFVDDPSWSNRFRIHACSFIGPSYKRGPPKGYINAIEQRMQHFEALLGVMMQTSDPRALSLIADLRQDELARSIFNRVDAGRFVRCVRLSLDRPRIELVTSLGPYWSRVPWARRKASQRKHPVSSATIASNARVRFERGWVFFSCSPLCVIEAEAYSLQTPVPYYHRHLLNGRIVCASI